MPLLREDILTIIIGSLPIGLKITFSYNTNIALKTF